MTLPKFKPGPVEYWLAAAATEFANGFIAGLGGGSFAGIGTGAATATTELGSSLPPFKQIVLSLIAIAATATGNGLKRVIVWHDQNPFPNPWPKPADDNKPTI
jgi:alcohol dehydrogenase class IV